MRAFALISSLLSSVLASTGINEVALRMFILHISKYPLDSIPTELQPGLVGLKRDLREWARLSESDFIRDASDEIRTSHNAMMTQATLRALFAPTLREMTDKYESEDERITEFAKIYRRALRNMQDFKRK